MSASVDILAKSTGVTLTDHTQHLREQFEKNYLPSRKFVVEKYARLAKGGNLVNLTIIAIQWHDIGKKHPLWQQACRKDYELWKAWEEGEKKGKKPAGTHLQRSGMRHEMDSLARMVKEAPDTSTVIQAAVAAHHSKLNYRHRERWLNDNGGEFKHLWKPFVGLSDEVDFVSEFEEAVLRRYEYAGPRAVLQLADHRASAMEDGKALADFAPFSYEFPFDEKRGPQKEIPKLWDEPLALLRAPTGAGKTDAALLWAQHQIEQGRADRLVIAMPTRFTANSLAISNAKNLSRTGLYHSSAWYQRIRQANGRLSKSLSEQIDAEQDMARLLETPITVTTLDHLCICLTGTREDHHAIFFNLAHSCVVIDEADFYDAFTQANLVVLLRVLKLLQVPVLLMSATLPESSRQLYGVSHIFEDTSDSQRIRCRLKTHGKPIVKPSDAAELMQPILDGKSAIIYANTVQRAQRYYKWLLKQGMNPEHLVLYHSRFTEPDKLTIEERLRRMLGKEAWEEKKAYGVAILTQIGELSVNISADYMLSELCPADRLVQRVGRLARFSQEPGELHLLLPHKKNKEGQIISYPAPYGSYQPGRGWEPAPALVESARVLVPSEYSAAKFVELVNALYSELPELDSRVRLNQRGLRELIGMNWLLQRENEISEDADQTKNWKCRDIDPQVTVLIGMQGFGQFSEEDNQIRSYREWRRILLEHGISCQTYEFKRALEQGCIEEAQFVIGSDGREIEKTWLVKREFYSSTRGLSFDDPEDDDE